MSKRTTEKAREVQNGKMENENDPGLGDLVLECEKGIGFYAYSLIGIIFALMCGQFAFQLLGLLFQPDLFTNAKNLNVLLVLPLAIFIYLVIKIIIKVGDKRFSVYENALLINETVSLIDEVNLRSVFQNLI